MRLKKIVEAADAVAVIHAGDTVASAGYAGSGTPDQLFVSLEQRFLDSGSPRDLTLVFSTGQGDMKEKGLNRLAHEGLVRRVIGGYFGLSPKIEQPDRRKPNRGVQPAGRSDDAALPRHRRTQARHVSRVGLGTYIDPRHGGGRMNERTTEDIVRLMPIDGEDVSVLQGIPDQRRAHPRHDRRPGRKYHDGARIACARKSGTGNCGTQFRRHRHRAGRARGRRRHA